SDHLHPMQVRYQAALHPEQVTGKLLRSAHARRASHQVPDHAPSLAAFPGNMLNHLHNSAGSNSL
ncbi:MAG: hypothetical protein L0I62_10375, partial [Gammaproteobacteria bacterium]|nr:hypothetical protein [Gammaproteobacteria bacterium]